MKFSIKDFFSTCDQIRRKLGIWSHLLEKSLMEIFIFCEVPTIYFHELLHFYIKSLTMKTKGNISVKIAVKEQAKI